MNTSHHIYSIIKSIPKGKVATYGQIAKLAGGINPRYVGYLLHTNPDPMTIPCHRVVTSQGKLAYGFAFGGLTEHRRRLEREGVEINNDTVDLLKYQWSSYAASHPPST